MEYQSDKKMHDKDESAPMEQLAETRHSNIGEQDILKNDKRSSGDDDAGKKSVDWKGGEHDGKGASHEESEVNMEGEATISPDDVIRAGGFGARDDIGCFLPVASDSTDLEASILDARDYEEPQAQGEGSRPGLGWSGTKHGE
ncbi:hypothetical protein L6164_034158 [Bauhinia variegata]|uniref:Uncharacterized protein n=1 Tax=Bauhinia variegata TaxID=167791 RepID=A0ACB9KU16_BAUVA|nr:hypothetical protein L6164_034158 [Bauhinia variegata]